MAVNSNVADGDLIKNGMKEANAQRDKYAKAVARGELGFPELVVLSNQHEYRALKNIKLLDILANKPGWSESTAIQALRHADLDTKDKIVSIRRNKHKIEVFDTILTKAKPGQWRARPPMPTFWPWSGKIELIAKEFGAPLPEEFIEVLESSEEVDTSTGEIIEPETRRKRSRGDSERTIEENAKEVSAEDDGFNHLFDDEPDNTIRATINDNEVDSFFSE